MSRNLRLGPFIGLACLVFALTIEVVIDGTDGWERSLLLYGVTFLVGANGLTFGLGHIFYADRVADSIGWPRGSPFQFEVGLANLSYGVAGLLAGFFEREFWLAVIIAAVVFYSGAALGHLRQMIRAKNFAPGNAGVVFYYDILAPIALLALYLVYDLSL